MKLYDKFFEPITDLDKKGFFADKLLTGKVTFTKKRQTPRKTKHASSSTSHSSKTIRMENYHTSEKDKSKLSVTAENSI